MDLIDKAIKAGREHRHLHGYPHAAAEAREQRHSRDSAVPAQRANPEIAGQIVVIGGGAGSGLQAARRARAGGAGKILTGRAPAPPKRAAARFRALSSEAFDAVAALDRFAGGLLEQAGDVVVTAAGPVVR